MTATATSTRTTPSLKMPQASGKNAYNELIDWQHNGMQRLQTQSPRYRNYQRAMMQRSENARLGRINAAVMNLARQGYSMPEIREILRNQKVR